MAAVATRAPTTGERGVGFGVSASPAGTLLIDGSTVSWKAPFSLNRLVVVQTVLVAYFLFRFLGHLGPGPGPGEIARLGAGS